MISIDNDDANDDEKPENELEEELEEDPLQQRLDKEKVKGGPFYLHHSYDMGAAGSLLSHCEISIELKRALGECFTRRKVNGKISGWVGSASPAPITLRRWAG